MEVKTFAVTYFGQKVIRMDVLEDPLIFLFLTFSLNVPVLKLFRKGLTIPQVNTTKDRSHTLGSSIGIHVSECSTVIVR